ncbi:MAG: VIT1/CCC1 transporter family protein [Acidimicrobiia bacterium]|nr:VIT1/CCC1 transporter family protein [Acidimicrobiia bacterium]
MREQPSSELRTEHHPAAIADRLADERSSYLQDWVLGAVDGTITTFAIAAGVVGAGLSSGVVVVLGVANLLADGLSMAASRYLGAQSELERRASARRRERQHISLVPEGEREEVRQILAAKGFAGTDLASAVEVITADPDTWVDFMLTEELGFLAQPDRPIAAATATFVGFVVCGVLPIAPFVVASTSIDVAMPWMWSGTLTAAAFVAVGALKGRLTGGRPIRSALQTLAVGGTAAAIALLVGHLLRDLT